MPYILYFSILFYSKWWNYSKNLNSEFLFIGDFFVDDGVDIWLTTKLVAHKLVKNFFSNLMIREAKNGLLLDL